MADETRRMGENRVGDKARSTDWKIQLMFSPAIFSLSAQVGVLGGSQSQGGGEAVINGSSVHGYADRCSGQGRAGKIKAQDGDRQDEHGLGRGDASGVWMRGFEGTSDGVCVNKRGECESAENKRWA
ncbi:hypothetical protein FQN55_000610 [Onygenales sp. PD_40]|nr:hypothetical protein FQN55_000610 [Onygenales sp. PD_40]KAK2787232.1 hypothetical protein FQN52_007321 [Onygenales sp. PD_12]KAK2788166.1 hypothetical protein FQN53_004051 [Emmonsiellopsis sp. PD_33]